VLILLDSNRSGIKPGAVQSLMLGDSHRRDRHGFRNLADYIARCLLEAGGFRPALHRRL